MKVKATANSGTSGKREIEAEFEFGSGLSEMTNIFGQDVVFVHARANMVIALQNALRGWMQQDLSDERIKHLVADWEMPTKKSRARPDFDKLKRQLARLSEEDRKAILQQ